MGRPLCWVKTIYGRGKGRPQRQKGGPCLFFRAWSAYDKTELGHDKNNALKAELDREKIRPHIIRHCCPTHLLENRADLSGATMLRHADIFYPDIHPCTNERLKSIPPKGIRE